ncbi:MAG: hypothetical protein ACFFAO_01195 [Candidatus Hermodarchaeota archaeon]
MTKEIFVFDIDGCVMPPIISNFVENGETRDELIKNALKKGAEIHLYAEFVKYYEKHCKKADSVLFITGRKKSEFGELTEIQLKSLKNAREFEIIYYPEELHHTPDEYFEWKSNKIQKIVNGYIDKNNSMGKLTKKSTFNIFDDLNEYFPILKKFFIKKGLKINLVLIEGEESWKVFRQ